MFPRLARTDYEVPLGPPMHPLSPCVPFFSLLVSLFWVSQALEKCVKRQSDGQASFYVYVEAPHEVLELTAGSTFGHGLRTAIVFIRLLEPVSDKPLAYFSIFSSLLSSSVMFFFCRVSQVSIAILAQDRTLQG